MQNQFLNFKLLFDSYRQIFIICKYNFVVIINILTFAKQKQIVSSSAIACDGGLVIYEKSPRVPIVTEDAAALFIGLDYPRLSASRRAEENKRILQDLQNFARFASRRKNRSI